MKNRRKKTGKKIGKKRQVCTPPLHHQQLITFHTGTPHLSQNGPLRLHRPLRLACLLTSKGDFYFLNLFISTDKKYNYRSERMLDESGISVAPPPRSHLATTLLAQAPPSLPSQHTRQHRPEPPAGTDTNQTNQPNKKKQAVVMTLLLLVIWTRVLWTWRPAKVSPVLLTTTMNTQKMLTKAMKVMFLMSLYQYPSLSKLTIPM